MKRAVFRYVESLLYSYHDLKREVEEVRRDIIEAGVSLEQALLGSRIQANRHYDPTESKGIRLATNPELRRMLIATAAIEKVIKKISARQGCLVVLHYWQRLYSDDTLAKVLGVNAKTIYNWRVEIVDKVNAEIESLKAIGE